MSPLEPRRAPMAGGDQLANSTSAQCDERKFRCDEKSVGEDKHQNSQHSNDVGQTAIVRRHSLRNPFRAWNPLFRRPHVVPLSETDKGPAT